MAEEIGQVMLPRRLTSCELKQYNADLLDLAASKRQSAQMDEAAVLQDDGLDGITIYPTYSRRKSRCHPIEP